MSDKPRLAIARPGGRVRWSDIDPQMAVHAAINRLRLAEQRGIDRAAVILERLEAADRERAEAERAARAKRLGR